MHVVGPFPSSPQIETTASVSNIFSSAEIRRLGENNFDKGGKSTLKSVITQLGNSVGLRPDLQAGIHSYVLRNELITSEADVHSFVEFLYEAGDTFGNMALEKARGFVYLPDGSERAATTFRAAIDNARFLFSVLPRDFFAATKYNSTACEMLEAPIAESDFYLTLKGTSGSGTISLDMTISKVRKNGTKLHPLWKMGLDTKESGGVREGRIIRSGSTLGKPVGADSTFDHREAFREFRNGFKISPQRALACVCVLVASAIGCTGTRALTDEGASRLSTLRDPQAGAHYNKLFSGLGFQDRGDSAWTYLPPDGPLGVPIVGNGSGDPGLQRYERRGLSAVLQAFNKLGTFDGSKRVSSYIHLPPTLELLE